MKDEASYLQDKFEDETFDHENDPNQRKHLISYLSFLSQ